MRSETCKLLGNIYVGVLWLDKKRIVLDVQKSESGRESLQKSQVSAATRWRARAYRGTILKLLSG